MNHSYTQLREIRLQKLFDDCQKQIIGQIIGPFGLSPAMFEDKNGGNVTTLHNFERADDTYVATDSDKTLHAHSKQEYERESYEDKNKFDKIRETKIDNGIDEYTGKPVYRDEGSGKTKNSSGVERGVDLDHITSLSDVHKDPKNHLALGKVGADSQVDTSAMRDMANDENNLALTNSSANRSKGAKGLKEWSEEERKNGKTNAEEYELNKELINQKAQQSEQHIDQTTNRALHKKQATELLQTGANQALKMGARQAWGVILVELVNGLYNEVKSLIKAGAQTAKALFQDISRRLQKVASSVIKKIPDAFSQFFQGGISGFISNLLTFLINQFVSTAKRLVAVIREGLLSLFKAFKTIMFPPKNMTEEQAIQEGLKILSATVITSVGIFLSEGVSTFIFSTFPWLTKEIAEGASNVLIGLVSGLLSAFLAYQIDNVFERRRQDGALLDAMAVDAKTQQELAHEMTSSLGTFLTAMEMYADSIKSYQTTGQLLAAAGNEAQATQHSLALTLEMGKEQVEDTKKMTAHLHEIHAMVDDFLQERTSK